MTLGELFRATVSRAQKPFIFSGTKHFVTFLVQELSSSEGDHYYTTTELLCVSSSHFFMSECSHSCDV